MSFTELYSHNHNQGHRDPISGGGTHAGQRGTKSLGVVEIVDIDTPAYTQANLYRDLATNSVPEKRDKGRTIIDTIKEMGNHNDKYFNRSLAKHKGYHAPIDLNHINK